MAYIEHMAKDGTYGDHLTLMALMREFNLQCLVLSSSGIHHTTLVSNDGVYYRDIHTIILGHFSEDQGIHYVSLEIEGESIDTYIDAAWANTDKYWQDIAEQQTGEMNTGSGQPHVDDCSSDHANTRKPTTIRSVQISHLPTEILHNIFRICIQDSPTSRYTLSKVNAHFRTILRSITIPLPEIYISSSIFHEVPNPLSVNRIMRTTGA